MRIVLLAVAVLLILLLTLTSRTRRPPIQSAGRDPLAAQLQRWTTDGLLNQDQATAILTAEHARVPVATPPFG